MKRCANPHCNCLFTPSKYNPAQKFCGSDECKRFRDAQRQDRHYQENIGNQEWAQQHLERKKQERERRVEKQRRRDNGHELFAEQSAGLNKALMQLVAGIVSLISGAQDVESVESILHQCWRTGSEFYPDGIRP